MRMLRRRITAVVAGAVMCAGGALVAAAPAGTGPVPGQPASLSAVDLDAHGYIEQEFFVEGTARAYEPAGQLTENGRWNVQTTTTAPYRTRVLVRRPKDPSKFNGVVEMEWLNVSGGLDAAPDWGLGNAELLRGGVAWGDGYSYDIYSQIGEAIRHPNGTNLLGSRRFKVKTLIGDGESQSAFRMVTYINAIQPQTDMFDGFFVHSRFAVGAPLADGGQSAIP